MQRPMPGLLIIGFEDSAEGRDALALGAQLAQALDARPLIARALVLPEGVLSAGGAIAGEIIAALEGVAVRELAEPLVQLADLGPLAETLTGSSAARVLHDLAESHSAVAAVVGSSARGAFGRLVPGSTAERLLHGAPCAVAVAARGYAAEGTRPLRVAVAFDGSGEAALALRAGITIAGRCNSTLTLLTVVETVGFAYTPSVARAIPVAEYQVREEQRRRRTLDGALGRVPPDLPADGRLLHGAPGQALVDASKDFDLIVVGSRGYGPLRRTLLGSSSRRLFNGSACSVMALPRGMSAGPFAGDDEPLAGEASPDNAKERA